jgi:Putative zinc-finger
MTFPPPLDCRDVELSLGVLVLGALEPAERPGIEAHLAGCTRCTAILAELAPLPGLLHRLDPVAQTAPAPSSAQSPPPSPSPLQPLVLSSPDLRARLVDLARAERLQRRRKWAGAVAAAAVIIAVLGVGAVTGGWWGNDRADQVTVASATDARSDVRADVSLMRDDTGSQLALRLTGVAPEEHCKLVAVDADGHWDVAAAWVATYQGQATVTGHSSFRPDQIKRLLVVTDAGRTLVKVPIRG